MKTVKKTVFAAILAAAAAAAAAIIFSNGKETPPSIITKTAYLADGYAEGSLFPSETPDLYLLDPAPSEDDLRLYANLGVTAVPSDGGLAVCREPSAAKAFADARNAAVFFDCEISEEALRFLSSAYEKPFFTDTAAYKGGKRLSVLTFDMSSREPTELIDELYADEKSDGLIALISGADAVKKNENGAADVLSALFMPSARYDTKALTVGIPSSRSFSTTRGAVWFTGGCDPEKPLYLNGAEVAVTPSGLFSVRAPLSPGKNVITLENGENALTFNIDRPTSAKNAENSLAAAFETDGKTAVLSSDGDPLVFTSVPITSSADAFYAPSGAKAKIIDRFRTKNRLNNTEVEVYALENGLFALCDKASVTDEPLPAREIKSLSAGLEDGFFTVRVKTVGAPVFAVREREEGALLTFYGVKGPVDLAVPENPLFKDASFRADGLLLRFKEGAEHLGYIAKYEGDEAVIAFRLPKKAGDGEKPLAGIKIMLDAGHSPHVGGTQGPDWPNDLRERVLNYRTATLTAGYLRGLGAEVVLSRGDSEDVVYRASEVKKTYLPSGADIAVSIHYNAVSCEGDPLTRRGVLTIYANAHSKRLAETVAAGVSRYARRPYKNAAFGDYIVCHVSSMPSIIIECGYLTNICEYDWFLKPENGDAFAASLARSIYDYFAAS